MHHKWQSYNGRFLRYGARQTEVFVILDHFFSSFTPLWTQKIRNFNKWKKHLKIWKYYHFTNVYHKWQSFEVWFLKYKVQQTEFFVILDHFLPFHSHNNPKSQNFEKIKKPPGDIITLHRSTINDNHMMGCMVPEIMNTTDRIFVILDHFLPF